MTGSDYQGYGRTDPDYQKILIDGLSRADSSLLAVDTKLLKGLVPVIGPGKGLAGNRLAQKGAKRKEPETVQNFPL